MSCFFFFFFMWRGGGNQFISKGKVRVGMKCNKQLLLSVKKYT